MKRLAHHFSGGMQEAQKRVFSKWVLLNLDQTKGEELTELREGNFGDAFQDGTVLLELVESLSQSKASIKPPKSQNKLQVMGFISEVVAFLEAQKMRLTISAENIYAKDETMILGLIWMLILKYQVGKKAEILQWLQELLEGEKISNFDADWRNGILFCKLVNVLGGGDSVPDDEKERLDYAFTTADEKLGIRELLCAEDVNAGYFDERSCLTYLSYFYNKYKNNKKVEPPPPPPPHDDSALHARIKELEGLCDRKDVMLDKSQAEIDSILKNMKSLTVELEEQKEVNGENEKAINELQLKIPFMNQKAAENTVPAPSGTNVSLVVFDVEDAEGWWDKNANDTAASLQLLQSTVRDKGKKYGAFEAETVNEKMVFAFSDSCAAMGFIADSQQELNGLEWPESFTNDREEFYKGIPTVVALHTGTCAFLDGTYTGPAVRVVNRLISAARGGEVLTTQATWDNCESNEDSAELLTGIAMNELGTFEVKEIGKPIDILQLFPESLKQRSTMYKEFEFLTPDEKQQMELKDKLAKLQGDNESLKVKLEATEVQAKKARDRALELNKWLAESRSELRTTVGEQIQAAMAEVATLIRESEQLETDLRTTKKQLNGAKKVMDSMNSKIKQLSQKNAVLGSKVTVQEREQVKYIEEIERLEEEILALTNNKKPKKKLLYRILPSLEPPKHAAAFAAQKSETTSPRKRGAPGSAATVTRRSSSTTDLDKLASEPEKASRTKTEENTKSSKKDLNKSATKSSTEPLGASSDTVAPKEKKKSIFGRSSSKSKVKAKLKNEEQEVTEGSSLKESTEGEKVEKSDQPKAEAEKSKKDEKKSKKDKKEAAEPAEAEKPEKSKSKKDKELKEDGKPVDEEKPKKSKKEDKEKKTKEPEDDVKEDVEEKSKSKKSKKEDKEKKTKEPEDKEKKEKTPEPTEETAETKKSKKTKKSKGK